METSPFSQQMTQTMEFDYDLLLQQENLESELYRLFRKEGWGVQRRVRIPGKGNRKQCADMLLFDGSQLVGAVEARSYRGRIDQLLHKLAKYMNSLDVMFILTCVDHNPYLYRSDGALIPLDYFPTPTNYHALLSESSLFPIDSEEELWKRREREERGEADPLDEYSEICSKIRELSNTVSGMRNKINDFNERWRIAERTCEGINREIKELEQAYYAIAKDLNPIELDGKNALVFLATGWGFTKGGINSYNTQLVKGLAKLRITGLEVFCLAPNVLSLDIANAEAEGFKLVSVSALGDDDAPSYSINYAECVKQELGNSLDQSYRRVIWVGHDIYTGDVALQCKKKFGIGECAIFHHMAYEDYYSLMNTDHEKAREKEREQRRLIKEADYVFANGPLLTKSARDMKRDNKGAVFEVLSGLADVSPAESMPESGFKVVFFGRIEGKSNDSKIDNSIIKQAYLAFSAWAKWLQELREHGIDPNSKCKMFGCEAKRRNEIRKRLTKYFKEQCSWLHSFELLPYEKDRKALLEELAGFSMCMMPSTREGFGMTALEAISAGVPVAISEESGFYQALDARGLSGYVHHFSVKGSFDEPYYHDDDLKKASDAIWQVFCAQEREKRKVLELRNKLKENGFTWEAVARSVIDAIWKLV